jgi:hypothetical protein
MAEINSILRLREQYPMYENKSDQELVEGVHKKFYSDRPIEDVYKHLNYTPTASLASTQIGEDIASFGRAAKSFHGSVQAAASGIDDALWSIMSDPKAAGSALLDIVKNPGKAGSGIKDYVNERFGSIERARKTFETDPAGFILDVSTAAGGGPALVRKLGMAVTKTGRHVIPTLTAKGAGLEEGALKTAGEAGRLGDVEAAEYKAGVKGQPSPAAELARGAKASEGLAYQDMMELYGQAGRDIRAGGLAPNPKMLAGTGAAALTGNLPAAAGMAGMTAATSPRLLGSAMYGLGAMERGARNLPRTRTAIAAAAADMLKDRDAKKELPPTDIKTLRAATQDDAGSATMLAASRILGSRPSPYGGSDIAPANPPYGGIGGDRVATPSPGQASTPTGGPGTGTGPVSGPAGPGPAGAPPAGPGGSPAGPGGPLTGEGPLPLPGQSPGLSRVQTTGQEPVAETRGGQTLMEFMWKKMLEGSKDLSADLREAGRSAFFEPEKFDPKAPVKAAQMAMGRMPFAGRGQAGVGGGKLVQPGKLKPAKIEPDLPSQEGYVYHATNTERAVDIAREGLKTHKPHEFTDQSTWPDRSTEKRNYFTPTAKNTWQFAPEEGQGALLRIKREKGMRPEGGSSDLYSTKKIDPSKIEMLAEDGKYYPLSKFYEEET